MDKRIVFKNEDGSCGVILPSPAWAGTLEELAAKDVPAGKEWRIVDADKIPADRTFRDAWTDDDPTETVDINMPKARDIHMQRIRTMRDIELAKLDVEQLKGSDVAAQKQILRDIPQTFDLSQAQTPEQLVTLWPSLLPEVEG